MHRGLCRLAFALGLLASSSVTGREVAGQEVGGPTSNPAVEVGREILRVLGLPRMADSIRDAGVPAEEVEGVFRSARAQRIPAIETAEVFEESLRAVREHGPMDNFGAFVQVQLASGLRGRDLAAAIHAEHARRGIGKGRRLQKAPGEGSQGEARGRRGPQEGRGNRRGGPGRNPGRGNGQGNGTGR